jgi:hypothetical protein
MTAPETTPALNFADLIGRYLDSSEELPLVHTTLCESFREIASEGSLSPRLCSVFGEPLVYLFYGRPSFRSRKGGSPSTSITHCPICFVFKPYSLASRIARVFPFDTGAAANGLFMPHIQRNSIAEYYLGDCIEVAQRLTHLLFGSNKQYFLGEAKQLLNLPDASEEVLRYLSLVSVEGETAFDDRRSAIEIQSRDHLSLRDTLMAVILPLAFLEDPRIRSAIVKDWRTYPLPYFTYKGAAPSDYYSVIRASLLDHLEQGRYV